MKDLEKTCNEFAHHAKTNYLFVGSSIGCQHGFGTNYFPELNKKWTRHTIRLPESMR